jgi:hypothetical protein
LKQSEDTVEWRADLMADVGQELILGLCGCQGGVARVLQAPRLCGGEAAHGIGLLGLLVKPEHQLAS